ncbi:hypothetical protein G5714_011764 [Onychostoma macrolepis]|uniref:Uncharacterized protein n=1 Tax=Onychostoma macrolepis TaxID=369639 RepID=A0A7J6CJG0_9TELE|nr:hypothetical protein G5714_011764 [Onychostoma macrolepis]
MVDEEVPATRPQVMPVFMGAPWAQRFGGPGSELSLHEWKTQTEYLAGLQGLNAQRKLQFVLGSLEGEAKRECMYECGLPQIVQATEWINILHVVELAHETQSCPPSVLKHIRAAELSSPPAVIQFCDLIQVVRCPAINHHPEPPIKGCAGEEYHRNKP